MNTTLRFSDRVENYVKARPSYPAEVVSLLETKCGLTRESVVTDVGCGTGLLAKLFCDYGCRVVGVEPNQPMREAGRAYLSSYPNFEMVEGTAEVLPLPGTSADFITAGQAFHWFNQKEARHEFMRILKPNGWAALVWNDRDLEQTGVGHAYEQLLETFGIDYAEVKHQGKETPATFERFFGNSSVTEATFRNAQHLDYDSFVARILSSSYMPQVGHPKYAPMMEAAERLFREHSKKDQLTMEYRTKVYYGQMS
jgi:ubiquinone/menaquinone biosynthesis C-methylase UbiE